MNTFNVSENMSAEDTISYIIRTYHIPGKVVIGQLENLFYKMNLDYGSDHSEISQVTELFHQLKKEITKHILEEEDVIFPAIIKFERLLNKGNLESDFIHDLMLRNTKMVNEHKEFDSYLKAIEELLYSSNLDENKIHGLGDIKKTIRLFHKELIVHAGLEDTVLFAEASELQAQLRKKLEEQSN